MAALQWLTQREGPTAVWIFGGGVPKSRKFKAAQMGGPSGGCMPTELLDTEIDYEALKAAGAMMGSGGLVVMDESTLVKSARVQQGGVRAKALLDILQWVPYRISLTGTPAPNGLLDLFGQFLALDGGYRLGTSYTHYRNIKFK